MRTLISGCMGSAPTDAEEDNEEEDEAVGSRISSAHDTH